MNSLFLKMVGVLAGSLLLVIGYEIAFPSQGHSDGSPCQIKVESAKVYRSLDLLEKNQSLGTISKKVGVMPTGKKVIANLDSGRVLVIQINSTKGQVWIKRSDLVCLE